MSKLYEFSALVRYSAVIYADSEEEARKEVETWENSWHDIGEIGEVVDVDLVDVRELRADDPMVEANFDISIRAVAAGEGTCQK